MGWWAPGRKWRIFVETIIQIENSVISGLYTTKITIEKHKYQLSLYITISVHYIVKTCNFVLSKYIKKVYYLPVGSGLTAPKTDGIIQRIEIKTISMFAGNINEVRLWKFKAGKLEMCKDFLIVLRQSVSYDFQE